MVYRHFVLRGTGNYGLKVSEAVTVAIGCDATVLVDADYANVSDIYAKECTYIHCQCLKILSLLSLEWISSGGKYYCASKLACDHLCLTVRLSCSTEWSCGLRFATLRAIHAGY